MADNWLEKREEQLRGAVRYRSSSPSLEQLLSRCREDGVRDASYKIHPLQLEAIASFIQQVGIDGFTATTAPADGEKRARIILHKEGAFDSKALVQLGEIIMALKLKAAQMGLAARLTPNQESFRDGTAATVEIEKILKIE